MTKYLAATLLATVYSRAQHRPPNRLEQGRRPDITPADRPARGRMAGFQARVNDAIKKIGDINDVRPGQGGKVENVVLGVGGFLGMGRGC